MLDNEQPNILICRLSALGDCVHTMPLLCALRRRFPAAQINWLTQTSSASIITGHADLDELITVERGFLRSPASLLHLRKQLSAHSFDLVFDPQSLTKSAVAGWLSGAKQRIGFVRGEGREAAPWLNNVRVRPTGLHVVDRTMELLGPLGIIDQQVEFKMPIDETALRSIDKFLSKHIGDDAPVVIHPGASWDSKLWPHRRYAQVARQLGERLGVPSLVAWAGERMRTWAEEIVANSGGHAMQLPTLSLPELVALLHRARLFIGSDSGPLHFAAALATPSVSMYGPTKPERNGPYGEGHEVLQSYYQEGTTRQRKQASNDAMQAISAAAVISACEQALENGDDRRSRLCA